MKSLNHLKHYEISKERLKFINGSNACVDTCEDACWHFLVVAADVPASVEDRQNCYSDCDHFC